MPKVSVIVPNYNHAKYLGQRLDSILQQSFQDFEVIILDDCSPDNSKEVIETYSSHAKVSRIEYNVTNGGSTFKQWNKGIALASGEWIWIAESDDYASPLFLETLMKMVGESSSISIAFANSFLVDENGKSIENPYSDPSKKSDPRFDEDFTAEGKQFCRDYLLSPIIGNASSAIFKKESFGKIGGADTSLKLCGDWKMWHEMLLHGDLAYSSTKLNYFRHHTNNVRSSKGAQFFLYELAKVVFGLIPKLSMEREAVNRIRAKLFNDWVFWMGHRRNEVPQPIQLNIFKTFVKNDPFFLLRIIRWPINKLIKKKKQ
jgi:glycosyltransferase involved in cell wall biosynthesis